MKQAMAPVTIGIGSSEAGDGPSYNRNGGAVKQAMAPVTIGMGSSEAGDGPSYNRDGEQ